MKVTRRDLAVQAGLAILALRGAALAQGVSPAGARSAQETQLYEAAKKEGQLTWYSGILDQPLCDAVGTAFTQKYPGVRVNALKTTSQVAFQRLLQDIKAGDVQSDVLTHDGCEPHVLSRGQGPAGALRARERGGDGEVAAGV
ncbi:MAG: hypothetical protein WDN49_10765 [Acetobacteraceae bacterium]